MVKINIKVYLPWYARGTPVGKPREGPPMALNDKPLFAIREGPSARGKPPDKKRLWQTLKTTIFIRQNSLYSQRYARLGGVAVVDFDFQKFNAVKSKDVDRLEEGDFDFDLSACNAPDNVKFWINNVKIEKENVNVNGFLKSIKFN